MSYNEMRVRRKIIGETELKRRKSEMSDLLTHLWDPLILFSQLLYLVGWISFIDFTNAA